MDFFKDCEQKKIQKFGNVKKKYANICGYSNYAKMKKRAAVLGAILTPISTKLVSKIAANEIPIPNFISRPIIALNAKKQYKIQSSQLIGEKHQKEFLLLARAVNAYINITKKDRQIKRGIKEVY